MESASLFSKYSFVLFLIILTLVITFIRIIIIRRKPPTYGKKNTERNKITTFSINSRKVQKQVLFDLENKQMSILDEDSSDIAHIDLSHILNVEILINDEPINIIPELLHQKTPDLSTYPPTINSLSIRLVSRKDPIFITIPVITSDTNLKSIEFKNCFAVARNICLTIMEFDNE